MTPSGIKPERLLSYKPGWLPPSCGCLQSIHARFEHGLRAVHQCLYLVNCVLIRYQIIYFKGLVAGDGWKFIQKFAYADTDANEVTKGFDADARTAEYRCAVLNLGVYSDGR